MEEEEKENRKSTLNLGQELNLWTFPPELSTLTAKPLCPARLLQWKANVHSRRVHLSLMPRRSPSRSIFWVQTVKVTILSSAWASTEVLWPSNTSTADWSARSWPRPTRGWRTLPKTRTWWDHCFQTKKNGAVISGSANVPYITLLHKEKKIWSQLFCASLPLRDLVI